MGEVSGQRLDCDFNYIFNYLPFHRGWTLKPLARTPASNTGARTEGRRFRIERPVGKEGSNCDKILIKSKILRNSGIITSVKLSAHLPSLLAFCEHTGPKFCLCIFQFFVFSQT